MPINKGDKIPSVDLFEGTPGNKVNIADAIKGKKVIIFGVPGAFTPTCSKSHLPGFIDQHSEIKGKGVDEVICVACNDPFVHSAWGEAHKADGKVRMLADPRAEFAKAIDLDLDLTAVLGSVRCKRFAMLVDNGEVKVVEVEPDNTGLSCSSSNSFLKKI
jgi:2-Cys peroxiredoxin 5